MNSSTNQPQINFISDFILTDRIAVTSPKNQFAHRHFLWTSQLPDETDNTLQQGEHTYQGSKLIFQLGRPLDNHFSTSRCTI